MVKLFPLKTILKKRNKLLYCDFGKTNEARHLGQTYANGKIKSQ